VSRKALVFDLDGTLVDTLPDLTAALNVMLQGLGRRPLAPAEVRPMIGDGSYALVPRALAATNGEAAATVFCSGTNSSGMVPVDLESVHRQFLEAYEAAPTKLSRLYPGVEQTLSSLRHSGARLGICTNKQQGATLAVLQGFRVAQYFDAIVGGDAVPYHKPDPRHLLAVIEQLGAEPNETVMVGDNENDYNAARGVGASVILMRYGYLRVPPETLSPNAWLDHFDEIPGTIAVL